MTEQAASTEALARRAREGDREAFEELVGRHADRLCRQIRSRLGPRVAAVLEVEDVHQETLARALVAIEKFRWQGEESFYRWLAAIAEHLIRNASQKKSLDTLRLVRDVRVSDSTASRAARREERLERLHDAIDRLTPEQRTALKFARFEGLTVREIALRMKRSENAVYALLSRALEGLRITFGDTESLGLPERTWASEEVDDDS